MRVAGPSGDGLRYTQRRARVTWESRSCCPTSVLMRTRDGKVARLRRTLQPARDTSRLWRSYRGVARVCVPGPIRPIRTWRLARSPDESKIDSPTQTLSTLPEPATASDPEGVQGSKADTRNDRNPQPEPDGVGKPISVQVVPDECFPAPGYVSSSRLRTWTPVTGYFAS